MLLDSLERSMQLGVSLALVFDLASTILLFGFKWLQGPYLNQSTSRVQQQCEYEPCHGGRDDFAGRGEGKEWGSR